MRVFSLLLLFLTTQTFAHIPALLLPIKGTPISSYFIGQSDISRAIYSELTEVHDFFVVTMNINEGDETMISLFSPYCEQYPQTEKFQPTALVIEGDLPWKLQGETNQQYTARLSGSAIQKVSSNYSVGKRPKFYEPFAKMTYWVGGNWKGKLKPGIYSIVIFDSNGDKGNFNISFNEKEAWTRDLYSYVAEVLPTIKSEFCNPSGFTGRILDK